MIWLETLPDDWWNRYQSISLSPQCIRELNIELLFLVRSLILETRTYARVCKRACLCINDFQNALDARNIHQSRNKSENTIISVSSLLDQTATKINELKLTIHWLAIDGEQPITHENPPPDFLEENSLEIKQDRQIIPSQFPPLLQKLFEMADSTKTK